MHGFTRVFMQIWFGFLVFIGGIILVTGLWSILSGSASVRDEWVLLLVPPTMFIGGFILIRLGRYFARDEARFLADFLRQLLEVADVTPQR